MGKYKLFQPFIRLNNRIKGVKEIKELLKGKERFMISGKYKIFFGNKIMIYLKTPETLNFIKKNQPYLTERECSLKRFFKNKIMGEFLKVSIINIVESGVNGSLIVVNRNKDFKIFDLSQNKIFTVVSSKEEYQAIKKAQEVFNPYFKLALIEFFDGEQLYTEEYINFKHYSKWSLEEKDRVINMLFRDYHRYLDHCSQGTLEFTTVSSLMKEFNEKIKDGDLVSKIDHLLSTDKFKEDTIPKVTLHGDMALTNNILFVNDEYRIIDFEDIDHYIFYYDLFTIIAIDFIEGGNRDLIINYMNGNYDLFLSKIFTLLGKEYDTNLRKEYMAIFIMERLLRFDLRLNHDMESLSKKYSELLSSG